MSSSVPNSSNVNNEPVAAPVDHHNQVINMDAFYAEHSSTFIPVHLVRSPAGLGMLTIPWKTIWFLKIWNATDA